MTRRGLIAGAALAGAATVAGVTMVGLAASRARARDARETHPPIGEFVEAEGLRIHHVAKGDGPPVVLLHGASGNLRDFTFSLVDRLAAQGLRPIAFDRPGLGWSERPEHRGWAPRVQARVLREAAAKLGAERPVVVGHSFGGAVAMAWAVDAPDRLRGALSLAGATHPWGTGVGTLYHLAATDALGWAVGGVARLWIDEDEPREILKPLFEPNEIPEGYASYIGVPLALKSPTFHHNAEDLKHLDDLLEELAPRYDGLKVPVEAIHGLADDVTWASVHSVPLIESVANGRLQLLEDVGHMVHHAREDLVVEAIRRLADG